MKNSPNPIKQLFKRFSLDQTDENYKIIRDYINYSNQVLSSQAEKNEEIISNLNSCLLFISSLPITMNSELFSVLSHQSQENYDFELKLVSGFGNTLCKSKYFTIEFEMSPLGTRTIWDYEKIPIEIKFFTSEERPQEILFNMMGKNFIKGKEEIKLLFKNNPGKYMGKAKFQVTEVSSHYPNGTVILVVKVKGENQLRIKPLVVKEVVIRAKEKTNRGLD